MWKMWNAQCFLKDSNRQIHHDEISKKYTIPFHIHAGIWEKSPKPMENVENVENP